LNCDVNIYEYLKLPVIAHFNTPLYNRNIAIKHALLSMKYLSFNTIPAFQRNTAGDSSVHFATSNIDRVLLKTVLFILR
jgi:hypothetical protein